VRSAGPVRRSGGMLTPRCETDAWCCETGADDYVTKPFSPRALALASVRCAQVTEGRRMPGQARPRRHNRTVTAGGPFRAPRSGRRKMIQLT